MMQPLIRLSCPGDALHGTVQLPASKSIANRILIIRQLCSRPFTIENLPDADDTVVLNKLLKRKNPLEDAGAGGTTFRFLLALRALEKHQGILTGSARLQDRPVGVLVNALREMGAGIDYIGKEGYPPLQLNGGALNGGAYTLDAGVSSQFISALMLIGPALPGGLILHRSGRAVSGSYVELTAAVMRMFGVEVVLTDHTIVIPESGYQPRAFHVGADWSAAVFLYAFAALLPGTSLLLQDLSLKDPQADVKLALWMEDWGVQSEEIEGGVRIHSSGIPRREFTYDFLNNPDLAQAFVVMAAVAGRSIEITGLSTLKDKETDRLQALETVLSAAGASVKISGDRIQVNGKVDPQKTSSIVFSSYSDHRMVMAASLLSAAGVPVSLEDPEKCRNRSRVILTCCKRWDFKSADAERLRRLQRIAHRPSQRK